MLSATRLALFPAEKLVSSRMFGGSVAGDVSVITPDRNVAATTRPMDLAEKLARRRFRVPTTPISKKIERLASNWNANRFGEPQQGGGDVMKV